LIFNQVSRRRLVAGLLVAALGVAACAPSAQQAPAPTAQPSGQMPSQAQVTSNTKAAALRSTLNTLLQEHVYLAASATNAALGGREAEFKAAADALDANSVDLAKAIGSVYGAEAERTFLTLWRSHINMFVDYTVGLATGDRAKQDKAVNDLLGYTQSFGSFINSATGLPKDTVAELVKTHVLTLKEVVDAQAAKDPVKAYTALRKAADHMKMVADPLAEATVKKFPEKFS